MFRNLDAVDNAEVWRARGREELWFEVGGAAFEGWVNNLRSVQGFKIKGEICSPFVLHRSWSQRPGSSQMMNSSAFPLTRGSVSKKSSRRNCKLVPNPRLQPWTLGRSLLYLQHNLVGWRGGWGEWEVPRRSLVGTVEVSAGTEVRKIDEPVNEVEPDQLRSSQFGSELSETYWVSVKFPLPFIWTIPWQLDDLFHDLTRFQSRSERFSFLCRSHPSSDRNHSS